MAKRGRKPTKKRTTTKNTRKQATADKTLPTIIMIVVSVLIGVIIYQRTGYMGKSVGSILGGITGLVEMFIPIGLFIVAIVYAKDQTATAREKILEYILLLICLCIILSVSQINTRAIVLNDDLSVSISNAYELGKKNIGGGAIGAMIAIPMVKLIGVAGTMVLSAGAGIAIFVFLLNIQLTDKWNEWKAVKKIQREEEQNDEEYQQQLMEKAKIRVAKKKARRGKVLFDQMEEAPMDNQMQFDMAVPTGKRLRRYDHTNDDLEPLGSGKLKKEKKGRKAETKEEFEPNHIENNLFKQEEEKKEDKVREVLTLEHSMTADDEDYEFPPITLLKQGSHTSSRGSNKQLADTVTKLQKTLYSFGVSAKVEDVSVGPAITRYEIKPAEGVRVNRIANLADDIALNLAAESIRIEAPIPGKQVVGIEIPNKENEVVHLRDILETNKFVDAKSKLSIALGKNVGGEAVIADIAKMPHVLIAGSTGSGKSVCINTLITSIIYKAKPSEVKLVMVDPKIVELSVYNGIPHLLIPVVTDPKKAAGALAWAVQEMEERYAKFAGKGVRDLKGYNAAMEKEEGGKGKMPQIVIIIDELADLMMVAAKDVEDAICRLAQKARAAGMHLVIATQRPSVDVITGLIKANVPSRIAFAVSSQVDSRTILDMAGAEKLLGKGDMLFYPSGASKPTRVQGAFVDDGEVEKIVDFVKSNGDGPVYNDAILETIAKANNPEKDTKDADPEDDTDPLLEDAIETVIESKTASTSFIQRRFKVGYARAGRIIDQMEERGVISGYQGSKPREVLMTKERWQELNMQQEGVPEVETPTEENT